MKIVLWALHEAGYRALRQLFAQGHEVLVITEENPAYVPSLIELARVLGQPSLAAASTSEIVDAITEFRPDLGISMYYAKIIDRMLTEIPRLGSFNFHPSLLPRHRGCFSAPWAIIEGDDVTGVTCHKMVEAVDRGPTLCQSRVPISADDTAFSLYYKLVDSAVLLLDEALKKIQDEPVVLTEQSGEGCFHKRAVPYDGRIDPSWSDERIDRFIRALYFPPHRPARVRLGENDYKVESFAAYRELMVRRGNAPSD
ncbi:MAG: methionyl-tRNA formyltransferase [Gammaproteobacteria bacterium]|nr:methionyl-tRNA formyltransferase [Gammaproteobacteria bacterium]